jgi:hypothetical protein
MEKKSLERQLDRQLGTHFYRQLDIQVGSQYSADPLMYAADVLRMSFYTHVGYRVGNQLSSQLGAQLKEDET